VTRNELIPLQLLFPLFADTAADVAASDETQHIYVCDTWKYTMNSKPAYC